jgi:hypothetical protein
MFRPGLFKDTHKRVMKMWFGQFLMKKLLPLKEAFDGLVAINCFFTLPPKLSFSTQLFQYSNEF